MDLFARAHAQLPLTPEERAFLKLIQGSIVTIIMAGVTAVLPFIESQQINWRTVAIVGVSAMIVTLFNTLAKYFSAKGDTPLSTVIGMVESEIQKWLSGLASGATTSSTPAAAPSAPIAPITAPSTPLPGASAAPVVPNLSGAIPAAQVVLH